MKAYLREKKYGISIESSNITYNLINDIKKLLRDNNIKVIEPIMPNEIVFSKKIKLNENITPIPEVYKSSGVYRVYFDDEIIYIGSSDCDGNIKGKRAGMWSRRYDFKSTLLERKENEAPKRYQCAASEVKRIFYNNERFPESDLYRIEHDFFPCHPDLAREIEFNKQQEYYDENNKLPVLNRVSEFVGGAKFIGNSVLRFIEKA
jgi:hypothetical protein